MTARTVSPLSIAVDQEGFLLKRSDWNKDIAKQLAACEHIVLTQQHWEIIYQVQIYFEKFELAPSMRPLIKYLKQTLSKDIDSLYLLKLFPGSPAKILSKISGLPKPNNCI